MLAGVAGSTHCKSLMLTFVAKPPWAITKRTVTDDVVEYVWARTLFFSTVMVLPTRLILNVSPLVKVKAPSLTPCWMA